MTFEHDHFTMSYHQARDYGIDYREFEKVDRLPDGIPLIAIAGVWGDYSNIRCLFMDADGNGYMRNIRKSGDQGYFLTEVEGCAKELKVGQLVMVATDSVQPV
ncbi:hypothetical protein [Phaeobacter gallaeciensis]|uniref:Uncharacterized protein n=1 Tax=Phaeobacter gallaeciensis TaxID=60890 RepID=A0AAD0EBG1_9RHOB|nr:hypothetical protein [Phaeobacter gallaeciensis]AHD07951.1 hypothetical protein Gal_00150 [Phaeobacter gallaeciensis DSM 26640]ATE91219.1 hypothetical protein PhaeoP11_00149 [Phaeobacter gallaeciensis]ATE95494.1 hypothetical protein PhaeoP73_00149 [Phaeobacter gallaeciensis]ATE99833.1 hypothetical protein PhaeoP75_00149 [Phaeobacter gallaeciensis]ATF04266.1 hypothetical protein PhaeoP63_00149 [Phaeobacter gallaeciensis]